MSQLEPGPHTAELDAELSRSVVHQRRRSASLDVRQGNDGTGSVGGTSGLTQQGAANPANQEKAYKATRPIWRRGNAQPDNNSIYEDVVGSISAYQSMP